MFSAAGAQVSTAALLVRQGCWTVLSRSVPSPPSMCGSAGMSQGWSHHTPIVLWASAFALHSPAVPQCFPSTQLCRLYELREKPSMIQQRRSLGFSMAFKQQAKKEKGAVRPSVPKSIKM